MKLSAEQISECERDGFLILENFVSTESCDRLRARAAELVHEFDPAVVSIFSTHEQTRTSDDYFLESGDKIRCFFEENAFNSDGTLKQAKEQSINKIGHALHDLDPVFDQFSRTTDIGQLIRDLGFDDPLLLQSMYIFKQPRIGGEVTCHQDATFLYTEPLRMVGLWFALEDASVENGCLWAIPGGHNLGLKSRFVRGSSPTVREGVGTFEPPPSRTRFEVLDSSPWPEAKLSPLEARKGTLIVLHPLLPHLSRENRSAKSRHAYTLHVIDASVKYPEENWLQRLGKLPLRGF
ncbi:MAG TPA: phytanoyl-CoA dioxygenase family protein [Pyrinomonadaceae bacterium]|nr:phytanoyl-CoA dioxygenase family protein [Pyrinomonadaceae bacterium]